MSFGAQHHHVCNSLHRVSCENSGSLLNTARQGIEWQNDFSDDRSDQNVPGFRDVLLDVQHKSGARPDDFYFRDPLNEVVGDRNRLDQAWIAHFHDTPHYSKFPRAPFCGRKFHRGDLHLRVGASRQSHASHGAQVASRAAQTQNTKAKSPANSIFVSRSGVSTCTESYRQRHSAQFFPMHNRARKKQSPHNRACCRKINGLRISFGRFGNRSPAQCFTSSRKPLNALVRLMQRAVASLPGILSSSCFGHPTAIPSSIKSCAAASNHGGAIINLRKSTTPLAMLMKPLWHKDNLNWGFK